MFGEDGESQVDEVLGHKMGIPGYAHTGLGCISTFDYTRPGSDSSGYGSNRDKIALTFRLFDRFWFALRLAILTFHTNTDDSSARCGGSNGVRDQDPILPPYVGEHIDNVPGHPNLHM